MNKLLEIIYKTNNNKLIIRKVKKGSICFLEGEKCKGISIVTKGKFEISSTLLNGDSIQYNLINENEIFGNNLLFSTESFYKGDIKALLDSEYVFIDKNTIINLLRNNEIFLLEYLKQQGDFTKKLNSKIKILSFEKAEDRLIFYLKENNNVINYDTITSLSSILNIKRETLSRLITKLIKRKKITRINKTIRLI